MSLAPGTRLGPYEITGQIGAGGMGEVYRARDTKLQRDVAIKILPEAFAHDSERLARFEREARTLASLNHPNIGQIYGLEESDGIKALVMELVEGPTLADRIAEGPIQLDEALPIAKQIAEALEAAHEQGIIHRDLKPANVKVRPDGMVKVLDFGLAKALEAVSAGSTDATRSPTISSPAMMTRVGMILGTAAYMSPEQAKGRAADKRSDVWAFGCVLYEMVTGRRAFEAEDISDTLAAVLRGEPDWTAVPANVSPALVALLRGCLDKDRRRRIGDLSTARFIIDHGGYAAAAVAEPSVSRIRRAAPTVVAVAAAAVIAAYATWTLTTVSAPTLPLTRFTIALPMGDRFTNFGVHGVALSADGSRLAYTANQRLYLRPMDQLEATPIRGTEGAANAAGRGPFFSPDGRWIGFWQDGQLKKVSITGGAPLVLCAAENPWGASWTTDNTILYGQSEGGAGKGAAGIWRVSSEGGKPESFVKVEAGEVAQGPQMLPGGRAILFTLARLGESDTAQIVVQSLDSGRRHVVVERGSDARYLPTGHLVYALDGTVLAVAFDVATLAVTGGAVPLVEDVAQQGLTAHFAISSQGALVYVPRDAVGGLVAQRTIVWVDRQGREDPIKAPPRAYFYPRLSPDGARVALDVRDQESDIWIWDLARETLTRLTFGPTFEQYGVWTPDRRAVIFSSSQFGGPSAPRSLFRRASDGTGTVEQLTQGAVAQFASAVTPDGTALIFREETPPKKLGTRPGTDLLLLPLGGERRAQPLEQTPFDELNAEVSPDGRWLAYQSNESGRDEIYVRPFPNVGAGKSQVSTNGGTQPLWARNGRELFFASNGALMRVPLTMGSTFDAGAPAKLLDSPLSARSSRGRPGTHVRCVARRPAISDDQGEQYVRRARSVGSDHLRAKLVRGAEAPCANEVIEAYVTNVTHSRPQPRLVTISRQGYFDRTGDRSEVPSAIIRLNARSTDPCLRPKADLAWGRHRHMTGQSPSSVTGLLKAWGGGDHAALAKLVPLVDAELHRLARRYMGGERAGHTLQPTALINEVYLRLMDWNTISWQDRAHFFGLAARLMRRTLVNHARRRRTGKRGAGAVTIAFDEASVAPPERTADLVAIDDALNALATRDERKSQIVELRFFGGLSVEETAEVLKISPRTVKREWSLARAWLYSELTQDKAAEG